MQDSRAEALLQALGRRIRELRAAQGFSQEAFADKCGLHRTFMGIVERGESNLSFRNIAKIAANLNIPLSTLLLNLEQRVGALPDTSVLPRSNLRRKA